MNTEYIDRVNGTPLFCGLSLDETGRLLKCMNAALHSFDPGELILRAGDPVKNTAVVISGKVIISQEDIWGGSSITASLAPGDIFAEAYACSGTPSGVCAQADSPSEILFIDINRVFPCEHGCREHIQLIKNLTLLMARKNLRLNERLGHLSRRSTKEKVLAYLSDQSLRHASNEFEIPFNRKQLADYLAVDRSALSTVLSSLCSQGMLIMDKNRFILPDGKQH